MDLTSISANLARSSLGIWVPRSAEGISASEIGYPEAGYEACFALEDASFWFSHRNEIIAHALGRAPFEGLFLDLGGGNGAVSQRLAREGIETVLLEPGESGAVNAQRRGIRTVVRATLEEAAFAPASFSGLGLFDVIEHLDDDALLLRQARTVLRPGGVLAVTVPAYGWLWSAEDDAAGHRRRYTEASLRTVLARAGFAVEYATYFFAALTLPIFLARAARYRLGRRPSKAVWEEAGRQHTPSLRARAVVDRLLAPEVGRVDRRQRIPFGTSCLAIAR